MKPTLAEFYAAYVEWLGLRSSLKTSERRTFARWIVRAHPELARPYHSRPAEFRLMCLDIQRGGRPPTQAGLGDATLRRYAQPLMRQYMLQPESDRGTFQNFLNGVLQKCRTERTLQRFLEEHSPRSPTP